MSLYDMYFSKKNKNYIFSILQDLILTETGFDINQNEDYVDLYRVKYPLIFDRTSTDNLTDLNKALLDEIGELFISDIQTKNINSEVLDTEPIKEVRLEAIKEEPDEFKGYYLNSTRRDLSGDLYNYTINIPSQIKELIIKEITIAEENNILFSNPIICLSMNDNLIYCKFRDKCKIKNRFFNTYLPIKTYSLECSEKLNIKFLNNDGLSLIETNDRQKIKKIKKICYENKNYLCLAVETKHNFKENDTISLYSPELIQTFIIDKILNNYLLFENKEIEYDKTKEYTLLNNSMQNNILINYC